MNRQMRALALVLSISAITETAAAQDCSTALPFYSATNGSSVCVANHSYPDDDAVLGAAGEWNTVCVGAGTPDIQVGGCTSSDITIDVQYDDGVSDRPDRSCAYHQQHQPGAYTGGTITVFRYGQYIDGPLAGELYECTQYGANMLAHEIGHALGLADGDENACDGRIMGRLSFSMEVVEDDCAVVDENWTTPIEEVTKPGGDPTVCQDGQTSCDPSPVVISLSGRYTFTSAAEGVLFDIDADGDLERVAWPAYGDVAFVALDRNANGRIDDGSELFGDHARLSNGDRARNGFEILAELDANSDSVVDRHDPAWLDLVLWFDRNHDGMSSRGELWPIAESEVTGLETVYRWIGRMDRHGNTFRYASRVRHLFGRRPYYDVFLKVE